MQHRNKHHSSHVHDNTNSLVFASFRITVSGREGIGETFYGKVQKECCNVHILIHGGIATNTTIKFDMRFKELFTTTKRP